MNGRGTGKSIVAILIAIPALWTPALSHAQGPQDEAKCVLRLADSQTDTDLDAQPDICDADDDGDGVSDEAERAGGTNPLDPDSDNDTISDGSADPDLIDATSGSQVPPLAAPVHGEIVAGPDNCARAENRDQADFEHDGIGDVCDPDDDNDSHPDSTDRFPREPTEWADSDSDGTGDNADPDDDNDTVEDGRDNCPLAANRDQGNADGDRAGDACDDDADADGLDAEGERAAGTEPLRGDSDGDAISDGPLDPDGSGPVRAGPDNCGSRPNPSQADFDADGRGDVCDPAPVSGQSLIFPPAAPGVEALSILIGAPARQRQRSAARKGVTVTGYCSSACTLTVAAYLTRRSRGGKVGLGERLGTRSVRLRKRGRTQLRIALSRSARRKIFRAGRRVPIRLLATARTQGGGRARQLRTLMLVRRG